MKNFYFLLTTHDFNVIIDTIYNFNNRRVLLKYKLAFSNNDIKLNLLPYIIQLMAICQEFYK